VREVESSTLEDFRLTKARLDRLALLRKVAAALLVEQIRIGELPERVVPGKRHAKEIGVIGELPQELLRVGQGAFAVVEAPHLLGREHVVPPDCSDDAIMVQTEQNVV
jgi:hypothetical protein